MQKSGLVGKLLAGFANLSSIRRKTQKFSMVVFENGKVTEIKEV